MTSENTSFPFLLHKEFLSVASDLHGFRTWLANVYFCGKPEAGAPWVLIGAGAPGSADHIVAQAEKLFGPNTAPRAIILTHGHFDQVGALEPLIARWRIPVYAHVLEMSHLTGRMDYLPADPMVGGGLLAWASFFYPHKAIDITGRVHPLPADHSVPELPGWRWVHTPGHTAGHVSLFRESDRVLLAGDAFVTVRQESLWSVLLQRRQVRPPPAYFTTDWPAAYRSIRALAALSPSVAATGHGRPMSGERLAHELDTLARNFSRIGVPARGRYVRRARLYSIG